MYDDGYQTFLSNVNCRYVRGSRSDSNDFSYLQNEKSIQFHIKKYENAVLRRWGGVSKWLFFDMLKPWLSHL